jgi:hypothetical protein
VGSKREQRLARKAAKERLRQGKHATEVQQILAIKTPLEASSATTQKIPAECKIGESNADYLMVYTTDNEDRNGTWSWGVQRNWHPVPGNAHVYGYLNNYTNKTWNEIRAERWGYRQKKRHVGYDVSAICEEAKYRLLELELDEFTEIFRFRMTARQRLYGLIQGAYFLVLWYDPTHEIYKVD